jgi:hypothetical protein
MPGCERGSVSYQLLHAPATRPFFLGPGPGLAWPSINPNPSSVPKRRDQPPGQLVAFAHEHGAESQGCDIGRGHSAQASPHRTPMIREETSRCACHSGRRSGCRRSRNPAEAQPARAVPPSGRWMHLARSFSAPILNFTLPRRIPIDGPSAIWPGIYDISRRITKPTGSSAMCTPLAWTCRFSRTARQPSGQSLPIICVCGAHQPLAV